MGARERDSEAGRAADAIRFVQRGRVRELRGVDPNTTVLNWLRAEGLTGTKEGCAEGDCGACTVALGEPVGGRVRYRAVNACIQFVPTLDGKQLITVEDLRGADGALHPVQQAMVDHHGSQCGFCTPGIVMSLFALHHQGVADRPAINDALAGNLCRCTGYRPIVDAALASCRADKDRFSRSERETLGLLASIRRERGLAYEAGGRRYYAPVSEDELAGILAREPAARILAGGTDLALDVTKQHRDLNALVHVGGVRGLGDVTGSAGHIEIGAAAPYSDAMAAIGAVYPDFGELLRRLGSVQIRNAGTMGGNIANASPIGDSLPPLLALGTTVVLRKGEDRRELPLDDFFLGYRKTALAAGEFLVRIRIPKPRADLRFAAYKIAKRFDQDISAVCAAFAIETKDGVVREARIAFGGMAATPKRASACEAALRGRPWSEATVATAAAALTRDFAPLSDMRASARYRGAVARNLLWRFYRAESLAPSAAHVLRYGT
jgi:xanthine dehydrogenase small subunit